MTDIPQLNGSAPIKDPVDFGAIAFQRIARSGGAVGKLDDAIEAFRINSETKARLQVLASQSDMNLTEFVRLVLECRAWGAEHVASLAAERIRQAVGSVG